MSQKRTAVVISYVTIFASLFVNLFFIPYIISTLGQSQYGAYRIIASFSGQLAVMNFGIATIVTRGIAKYNALEDKKGKSNFLFMSSVMAAVFAAVILVTGFVMYFFIDVLYKSTLTAFELGLAKHIYIVLLFTTVISVVRDVFSGIISGNEKFAVTGAAGLGRIILRVLIIAVLLKNNCNAVVIAYADLTTTVLVLAFELLYSKVKLKEIIKYYKWDKPEFKSTIVFAGALCLQSIVNQVNMNLDSTILGATITKNTTAVVTVYSVALIILTNFGSLTGNISGVFVPQATKMVFKDATNEQLTQFVVRIGRIQMMIASCALGGFILFGKEFLFLWMGKEYYGAYIPAILLVGSTMIPLIQSAVVAILDAKGKRMFRSIVLCVMAVVNIVSSVIFIKIMGYVGAAVGTCFSMILGHGVMMNIYYQKKLGLNVGKMFGGILYKTFPTAVLVSVLFIPASIFIKYSVLSFLFKCLLYLIVMFVSFYKFAMNEFEKSIVAGYIRKLKIGG